MVATPEVPTVREAKASLGKVRRERERRRKKGRKLGKSYNPTTLDRYKILLESFKCFMFPLRCDLLWSTGLPRTTFGSFPGTTGMHHHTHFIWCWGVETRLQAC